MDETSLSCTEFREHTAVGWSLRRGQVRRALVTVGLVRKQRADGDSLRVPFIPASPPSQDSHGGPQPTSKSLSDPTASAGPGEAAPLSGTPQRSLPSPTPASRERPRPPSPSSGAVFASEEGSSHRPLPTPGGCVILPRIPFGPRWPGPAPPRGNIPKKGRKENSESNWPVGEDRRVRWEKGGGVQAPGKEREAKGGAVRARGGGSALSRVGVGVGRAPWAAEPQPRGKYAGHVGGGAGRR